TRARRSGPRFERGRRLPEMSNGPTISIALFDGVEELDFAGPWEVLAYWARGWPEDGATVFTVGETLEAVTCAKGLRVLPDRPWAEMGAIDVLVYPGGRGTRVQIGDERIRRRVRDVAATGALMTSVCTGSLVYADAGLLDGRPATTHWSTVDGLASLGTGVEVRPDQRFVDDA